MRVRTPLLDGELNGICAQAVRKRFFRKGRKLGVGSKAKGDDLIDCQPGIQQLSGQDEVAQIFFGANATILSFEGENTGKQCCKENRESNDEDQRSAVKPLVVTNGLVEIHSSADDDKKQNQAQGEKARHALGVVFKILRRHRGYVRMGHNARVEIKPGSTIKAAEGNPDYFSGKVWIETLLAGGLMEIKSVRVTFNPGARTAWHTHPGGQLLHIVSGRGWVQKDGEPAQAMSAGDTVIIAAGEKHWHGAASDCPMVHLAVQPIVNGLDSEWLEQVSEEIYRSA